MVSISVDDIGKLGVSLDKILKVALKGFKEKFVEVLKRDFVNDYMGIFDAEYDTEFMGSGSFHPDDQTSPANIKAEVLKYVRGSLSNALGSLTASSSIIHLKAISSAPFSDVPSRTETDKLKLFYFYLYGMPGEYVVLNAAAYKIMRPNIKQSNLRLGRFGTVNMLPMDVYKRLYSNSNGGKKGWPSPEKIRHPMSGSPPSLIFDRVFQRLDLKKYVKKTIDEVTKS